MSNLQTHTIIGDNPIWRRTHPILLQMFCRGMQTVDKKWIRRCAYVSIAMSPLLFLWGVGLKSIHIGVLVVCWWFLREYISEFGQLHLFLLAIGLIIILYKVVYSELVTIFMNLVLLVSGCSLLLWLCDGYLVSAAIRQKLMMEGFVADFIAPMATSIPHEYFSQYEELIDLYMAINEPGNEEKLNLLLDTYEREGITPV